jgi:hypothetical protein
MSYFSQCLPTFARVPDGSGLSLTRASFTPMTQDEFAALDKQEDMQRVWSRLTELRMRGYRPNLMQQVLWGRLKDYSSGIQRIPLKNQSIIAPFVSFQQRHEIVTGIYEIVSGEDVNGYRWKIKVKNNGAAWQKSLPAIHTQFIVDNSIHARFLTAAGAAVSRHFKIIAVTDTTVGGTPFADVTIEPVDVGSTTFAGYTDTVKGTYRPTGGVALLGTNSVSNYRSWMKQQGVYNNLNLVNFPFQTSRKTYTTSDAYEEALRAENANEFFKVFGSMSTSDRIKIYDKNYQEEWANTIFWGQPKEGQDWNSDWKSALPVVTDPDGGETLEYEANAEGIEYQLDRCGQVHDMLGLPIDLDWLQERADALKQNRQQTNPSSDAVYQVDIGVDMRTARSIGKALASAYKAETGVEYTQEIGDGDTKKFSTNHGIPVKSYFLDDVGVQINVITDPFFAHLAQATPLAHRRAARYLFMIDWSDIDVFVMKSRSKDTEFPPKNVTLDSTRYVIDINHKRVRLESETWGVRVQVPERHLIVTGFSDGCAKRTVYPCGSTYEG